MPNSSTASKALLALLIGLLCWSVDPIQAAEPEGLVIDSAADLRALTARSVAGHVLVQSDQLKTLHGLEQLEYIGGDLSIEHCDSLQSLAGLHHLKRIEGSLRIPAQSPTRGFGGIAVAGGIGG